MCRARAEPRSTKVPAGNVFFGCEQDRYYHVGTARASDMVGVHFYVALRYTMEVVRVLMFGRPM